MAGRMESAFEEGRKGLYCFSCYYPKVKYFKNTCFFRVEEKWDAVFSLWIKMAIKWVVLDGGGNGGIGLRK